jgi:hypothetical protein
VSGKKCVVGHWLNVDFSVSLVIQNVVPLLRFVTCARRLPVRYNNNKNTKEIAFQQN